MTATNDSSSLLPRHGRTLWLLLPAAIALVIGLVLCAWRPIRLAPPYHAYSPLLYFLVGVAWIPLLAFGVWRLPKRRLLAAFLGAFFVFMARTASSIVAPHTYKEMWSMRDEDHGSLRYGSLTEQRCSLQVHGFECELAVGSSDTERVIYYSYRFERVDHLPIRRLTRFDSRVGCNPSYSSCSEPGVP